MRSLRRVGEQIIESRCEGPAVQEQIAALCAGLIGQIDLRFASAPIVLLIQATEHLSRQVFYAAELRLEVRENLLMRFLTAITDGDTCKLIVDRRQMKALDWDVSE